MSARVLALLAAAATVVGCASTPVFEGERAWSDGWREGNVEEIAEARDLGFQQSFDCRYRGDRAGREAAGRFAVVGVQVMGRHRHHVAPVEPGKEPEVGARVLSNVRGCEPPITQTSR